MKKMIKLLVCGKQFRWNGGIFFPGQTFEVDSIEELSQPISMRHLEVIKDQPVIKLKKKRKSKKEVGE